MTKDEALKMAIEDAMKFVVTLNNYEDTIQSKAFKNVADKYLSYASVVIKSLAISLKEALEQPAQEPVGWTDEYKMYLEWDKESLCDKAVCKEHEAIALYTQPHQWQGLTDDEIQAIRIKTFDAVATNYEAYRAIEQALKEKNHGGYGRNI